MPERKIGRPKKVGGLMESVQIGEPNECWPWLRYVSPKGYGMLTVDGKTCQAHRLIYEWLIGPIRDGMTLDHTCEFKACCNPAHLEQVTNAENQHRKRQRRTHCKHGHELTPENTYEHTAPNGWVTKRCRTCAREHTRRHLERRTARA